ncbi:hypothetical protein A2966_03530 [Candidatus Roizmanbacteria bacterium RIFCSPLOWO2_01_FULL_41_22]|uniref:Uncharacterized protein n=1 Tax=Candidatus Roizmanbacteria bacterium RIFCSPLOWO2_01_FULL_41_22 TaxID=1802067 RepID=A0A1F7JAG9_9BACT|nr:MAG: hypothetical protein A2966_03530 [Candidatus Roizmanbacteria bacterium RIFCSPLOWO2_01_FULL_41_22]
MNDLTVVYYTANHVSDYFMANTKKILLEAIGEIPIISVSQKPMDLGTNICVGDSLRSHVNIYRQALIGAKETKTKYIALAEDDVLYSPQHFKHRSSPNKFAYNLAVWGIFTWTDPPIFSYKGGGRINLNSLICERDLFIEAMEERFVRWPDESKIDTNIWAEPGKYEKYLKVTIREVEHFYTNPPNIMFSHETALSFSGLGTRKRVGEMRATEIPYWGRAENIIKLYKP